MGRCVYEGVYDPQSVHADDTGCRQDVLAALAELQMTIMRYPGGNFVSGYHWQDGVGPKEQRPIVKDLAWQSLESNQFGTDEFIALCRRMNWEPMLAVNLGTGSPEEARNLVEYCNSSGPSRYAQMRQSFGHQEPYDVKYWCLGNEMDGPWQLGHVPAQDYAVRAQQAAKMMEDCDRSITNVVCGSSGPQMPTFPEWDRTALEYVGGLGHYISLHRYVGNEASDPEAYLATGKSIDRQIESVDAVCRYVQTKLGKKKRTLLCFDEWNVWYKARSAEHMNGRDQFAPHLIEEVYNLEDTLVFAQFLNSFLRHADVVKIANLAQIVNVIAPILTKGDELLKQSIFYAFRLYSEFKEGVSLSISIDGTSYQTADEGEVEHLDAAAVLNDQTLALFLVNRGVSRPLQLSIPVSSFAVDSILDAQIMTHKSLQAANTFADPAVVVPQSFDGVGLVDGSISGSLPPASLTRIILGLKH